MSILRELSLYSVLYIDWRLSNVLQAHGESSGQQNSVDGESPSLSGSTQKPAYKYRLIDFEGAQVPCGVKADLSWIVQSCSRDVECVVDELLKDSADKEPYVWW